MPRGETCGFNTTDEEIEVYVGLGDEYHWEGNTSTISGKYIIGIYQKPKDLRAARRWNRELKYYEKCSITIHKIEDVDIE